MLINEKIIKKYLINPMKEEESNIEQMRQKNNNSIIVNRYPNTSVIT